MWRKLSTQFFNVNVKVRLLFLLDCDSRIDFCFLLQYPYKYILKKYEYGNLEFYKHAFLIHHIFISLTGVLTIECSCIILIDFLNMTLFASFVDLYCVFPVEKDKLEIFLSCIFRPFSNYQFKINRIYRNFSKDLCPFSGF